MRSLIVSIILIQKAKVPKDFLVACYVTQPLYFILRERLMVGGRCGPLAGRLLGKGCRGGALGVAQGWLLKVPFWQLLHIVASPPECLDISHFRHVARPCSSTRGSEGPV